MFGDFLFPKATSPEQQVAIDRMHAQISVVGGRLDFTVNLHEDGWDAVCQQYPSIITGGKEISPTEDEIRGNIKESIYTAFDILPVSKSIFARRVPEPQISAYFTNNSERSVFA